MQLKNYQYRLQPSKKQVTLLNRQLALCQSLYNKLLEQRIQVYEDEKKSLTAFDQCKFIAILKRTDRKELRDVHSQVLQNTAMRLDLAFKSFFRRMKSGDKAGFPRFKSKDRYDSITFPQCPTGCFIKDGKTVIGKVGHIKMKLHRPVGGRIKTATIRRTPTGKWFVTFCCEIESKQVTHPSKESVAFDLGLKTFASFSDGSKIENPRFYRREEKDLARAQRKGMKKVVARIHERIQNKRKDFCIKAARSIVKKYSTIYMEDLKVNRMVHNHCLAKSIHDASWGIFTQWLLFKAEEAGTRVVKVNPAYTSQDCSSCGHRERKTLGEREHKCQCCGFTCDRDLNASLNIYRLGIQSDLVRGKSPLL